MPRSTIFAFAVSVLAASANVACGGDDEGSGGSGNGTSSGGSTATGGMTGTGGSGGMGTGGMATGGMGAGGMVPFALTSTAFEEGGTWPLQYECGPPVTNGPGMNLSPPLTWTAGPSETQSYAIVMRDLDFMNLVHWAVFDIPTTATSLPEGIPIGYDIADPAGAKQAELQMVEHTYLGPCSPNSINTYEITIHALDVPALPGATMASQENDIAAQIEMMSIASASLSGES